ncbi:MAG: GDP-L-fucose synthase [Alphaproteobacteria bacterium]
MSEARQSFSLSGKRVWVAGHRGMAGSAIVRRLASEECEILTAPRDKVDLRNQAQVDAWMAASKPQVVFLAAAKVGGILANNSHPAQFLYDNLAIQNNVIEAARRENVEKLLVLGSSCIYPKLAPQPISEDALLTGPLEPTNEWYAIAKIAGLKLAAAYRREYGCDFISAMPTNLYGPGDNFDLVSSHVLPALIRKVHDAKAKRDKSIVIWGTGTPRREFLFVEDCADALVHLMKHYSGESHVNVGCGEDISVNELARLVCEIIGFSGELVHDLTKPDGTPRKLLNVEKLRAIGWTARTPLAEGIERTYEWFLKNGLGPAQGR